MHIRPINQSFIFSLFMPCILHGSDKSEDSIERLLVMQNPQNWLLFMDNKELQKALKRLSPDDLEFIFLMHVKDYTQAEMAATYHKSQATISKHYKVILKILKKLFENGYKKQGVMCL